MIESLKSFEALDHLPHPPASAEALAARFTGLAPALTTREADGCNVLLHAMRERAKVVPGGRAQAGVYIKITSYCS